MITTIVVTGSLAAAVISTTAWFRAASDLGEARDRLAYADQMRDALSRKNETLLARLEKAEDPRNKQILNPVLGMTDEELAELRDYYSAGSLVDEVEAADFEAHGDDAVNLTVPPIKRDDLAAVSDRFAAYYYAKAHGAVAEASPAASVVTSSRGEGAAPEGPSSPSVPAAPAGADSYHDNGGWLGGGVPIRNNTGNPIAVTGPEEAAKEAAKAGACLNHLHFGDGVASEAVAGGCSCDDKAACE